VHIGGLHFSYTEAEVGEEDAVTTDYRWLNEAITEHLAQVLTKGLDGKSVVYGEGTYRFDRIALDELVTSTGIPLKRFVDAYFEAKLVGISTKKYDDLFEDIEHELGQTVLLEISTLIKEVEDYLEFSDAVVELMYKSSKEQSR
jgi:hypothetical protein